jgi:membrane-bound metal-dependent hydrolase YbcI (DUF457 family)
VADNLTHGLAGALLAQTGFRQRYGPAATVALVVGAELPDLDALFALGGPVSSFVHHRGMTHSLLGGAGLALLGALLLWGLLRERAYWRLALLTYLGIVLHIGMDYLTSYGTQILWPFDTRRYTADAVFIIDYFYTGLMVVALLLIRMVRHQQQRRYGLLSLVGIGVGSALWYSAPLLTQAPVWLLAVSLGLMVALYVVRLGCRQPSRYGLVSGIGIGVGVGIVLWRMAFALTKSPVLQLLALQSGGVHVACFALVMGLGAWWGRQWTGAGPIMVLGRCGVAAVAGYIGLCLVSQTVVQHLMASALGPQKVTVERLAALPLPGWGLLRWRGIAETPSSYLVSRVTLVPLTVTPPDVIAKGPDTPLVQALRTDRLVRRFLHVARFPVVDVSTRDAERIVRFFDLRSTGDGRHRSRFDLVVRLNAAGQVQAIEFRNRVFPPTAPHL